MVQFADEFCLDEIMHQPGAQIPWGTTTKIVHQPGVQIPFRRTNEIMQQPVAQIPWRTTIEIMQKSKSLEEMLWYINEAHKNGWSRSMVLNHKRFKLNMSLVLNI